MRKLLLATMLFAGVAQAQPIPGTGSGSAGTQYTEADTDSSITGTAALMEGAANALVPLQGTAADGLLVNLGANNDISGTVTVTDGAGALNTIVDSGSLTCNAGTNLNTSALATEATLSTLEAHFNDVGVSNAPTLKGLPSLLSAANYIAADLAEAGSTDTVINATSHGVRANDIVVLITGAAANIRAWSTVASVTANSITLSYPLPAVVATSDTFYYYRPMPLSMSGNVSQGNLGALQVNLDFDYQENTGKGLLKRRSDVAGASDAGASALAVEDASLGATAEADDDYAPLRTTARGALWSSLDEATFLTDIIGTDGSAAPSSGGFIAMGTDGTNTQVFSTNASGHINIADGGNTITVDNGGTFAAQCTLQAGTAYAAKVRLTDGTTDTDIRDLTNSNALNVSIVDGSGDQITSFGGGVQYTEGDTDASISGTAVMWEDTSDTLRAASAAKPLPVNVVAGGAGDGAIQDGASSSIEATVLDYTNANPLSVRLTDTNGDYVGAGAGTQYTEDIASAADPIGTGLNLVRADALAAVTTTDGDNVAARGTNKGEVYVKHADTIAVTQSGTWDEVGINDSGNSITVDGTVAATQSGTWNITDISGTVSLPTGAATAARQDTQTTALQLIDDPVQVLGTDTYSEATSKGMTCGAVRRDADTTLANTTNEFTPLQVDANGRLKVEIFDGGDSHTVDGTVAATQSGTWNITDISGTVSLPTGAATAARQDTQTTALQLIDDPVQVLGTDTYTEATSKGSTLGAVRRDADTPLANTTNEFSPLITDANGYLKVEVFDGGGTHTVDAPLATPVNVQIGNATLAVGVIDETGASAVDALAVGGGTAHDAANSGNPLQMGGHAVSGSASPTSVTAADRSRWIFNQHGIPYVMPGHPNLITREYDFGTAAQTDVNLASASVAADERVYITRLEAMADNANSVAVSVRAGCGASAVPTASSTGVSGMIATHPGLAAGSGFVSGAGAGMIALCAAGEEPRITTSAATSGNLHVLISYFLIDETP